MLSANTVEEPENKLVTRDFALLNTRARVYVVTTGTHAIRGECKKKSKIICRFVSTTLLNALHQTDSICRGGGAQQTAQDVGFLLPRGRKENNVVECYYNEGDTVRYSFYANERARAIDSKTCQCNIL